MLSTLYDLSTDGREIMIHGLRARRNTDGSWDSNLEARKLGCDTMSPIRQNHASYVRWVQNTLENSRWLKRESRLRVSARVAAMLFLEGGIKPVSLSQVYEEFGEVVIPHVKLGDHELTLYVARGDDVNVEAVTTMHHPMMAW